MSPSRRAFLIGTATLTCGCSGLADRSPRTTTRPDGDGDGVPDGADDYPGDPDRAYRASSAAGTTTIRQGEFRAHALPNPAPDQYYLVHYEVSVAGETGVDCLVMPPDEYDAYVDGARDVAVLNEHSRTDVTAASHTWRFDGDAYDGRPVFVLDYTEQATAPGPDSVEVAFRLESARPPE